MSTHHPATPAGQMEDHPLSIFGKFLNQHVVVRTYAAGVHIGTLSDVETAPNGVNLVLTGARRLWRWTGAFTLSEVATAGIDPKGSRVTAVVPEHLLAGVIEIIPTTEAARSTFDAAHE